MPQATFSPFELQIDLKSAARLGDPEALDWALEGLRAWPAFAANAPLDEADVRAVLVPLGEILALPTVPVDYLHGLASSSWAGVRALAAVALAARALQGERIPAAWLRKLAADRRAEVRLALESYLKQKAAEDPAAVLALLTAWKQAPSPLSPRAAALALSVAAEMPPDAAPSALRWVADFRTDPHPDVQRALGEALRRLAAHGLAQDVLTLLETWLQEPPTPAEAYPWALRGSWAHPHRERALALLAQVEAQFGTSRPLRRARQSLTAEA